MTVRTLILAIDGVLNHRDYVANVGLSNDGGLVTEDDIVEFKRRTIDPQAVAYANLVLDAHSDVQVVVLSSWSPVAPELVERALVAAGLRNRFHGHTRRVGRHDGDEAASYVVTHKIDDYIVVTDCQELGHQTQKAVITHPSVGLTYKHAQDIIQRFHEVL